MNPGDRRRSRKEGCSCARGGTLLLDEIGDLPVRLQVALAKEIAKDEIPARTGAPAARSDVRFICTTSRDLKPLTGSGAFFKDLYDQINILPIEISSLGPPPRGHTALGIAFFGASHRTGRREENIFPQGHRIAGDLGLARQRAGSSSSLVKRNIALAHGEIMTEELVRQSMDGEAVKNTHIRRSARHVFARVPRPESTAHLRQCCAGRAPRQA